VARALGLPAALANRPPFPGPALAARVIGEATREKIALVRQATAITERILADVPAFQNMTILHEDRVTGMRNNKREFGLQLEIRCWDSVDARVAKPTRVPWKKLEALAGQLVSKVPGVVSVTYGIAPKPPSTMEVV
jgi:GMP synthase (glutamine-hydrolysing)